MTTDEVAMYDRAAYANAAIAPTAPVRRVLANPRVQGSIQAFGGLMEASVGAYAAIQSGGALSVPGFLIMTHGLDQFTTGMNTALSGRHQYTGTEQLLHMTGMPPGMAAGVDTTISIIGMGYGAAIARSGSYAAVTTPRAAYPKSNRTPSISKANNTSTQITTITEEFVVKPQKVLRQRFAPDTLAEGAHTVYRRNLTRGNVEKYQTYWPQSNPRNPNPWELGIRFDGPNNFHEHFNKATKEWISTPHVHDPRSPGGVRYPLKTEIPK